MMDLPEGTYSFTDLKSEDVEIGRHSAVAENCRFHGSDNHRSIVNKLEVSNNLDKNGHSKGKIKIGSDVWIGEGVRVLSGSIIEDGAIIGAGAVVSGYIPAYSIAVGNPAKVVGYRFDNLNNCLEIHRKLLKIKWWNWRLDVINERYTNGDFSDVEDFVAKYFKIDTKINKE